jgi:hypothetical protein
MNLLNIVIFCKCYDKSSCFMEAILLKLGIIDNESVIFETETRDYDF